MACTISGSNGIGFGYSMPVGGEIRLFRLRLIYINLKEISQGSNLSHQTNVISIIIRIMMILSYPLCCGLITLYENLASTIEYLNTKIPNNDSSVVVLFF